MNENILRKVGRTADRIGLDCYVVGGYVRDMLLGLPNDDIDVVVVGKGIEMAKEFAKDVGSSDVITYANYGTAAVKYNEIEVEFVGARKESYTRGSRKPIVENGTLQDDLERRDFTLNALAMCLNSNRFGEIVDLFNGQEDLKNRILRTPVSPDITFTDDPLRMLRCIRFASRFNFRIEENTWNALCKKSGELVNISAERIMEEFKKILLSPYAVRGIYLLQETGLLQYFLPELSCLDVNGAGHKNNFVHSVKVLKNLIERKPDSSIWLRMSALLHDIGKGPTEKSDGQGGWTYHGHEEIGSRLVEKIFRRLRLPLGQELDYVKKMVEMHMRPSMISTKVITDSAVRRLLFDAGSDIDDLMTLCRSDLTTGNDEKRARILGHFDKLDEMMNDLKQRDQKRLFQPCIGGKEIMEILGCGPCRKIGEIKDFLKEAILDGMIENDPEVLINIVKEKWTK